MVFSAMLAGAGCPTPGVLGLGAAVTETNTSGTASWKGKSVLQHAIPAYSCPVCSGSLRDLLRVIRNKHNHFRELPESLQKKLGSLPEGFLGYVLLLSTSSDQWSSSWSALGLYAMVQSNGDDCIAHRCRSCHWLADRVRRNYMQACACVGQGLVMTQCGKWVETGGRA